MYACCTTGTRLVFSREGLQEPLYEALFSPSELQSELHTIIQQLLVSATAVPDAVAFLQASLGYQVVCMNVVVESYLHYIFASITSCQISI